MPRFPTRRRSIWMLVLAIVFVAAAWFTDQQRKATPTPRPAPGDRSGWTTLTDPRLDGWGGNDGDSFRIAFAGGREVFRLYFVDTPEATDRFPDRLGHQSRYFGNVDHQTLMDFGRAARTRTLGLLGEGNFSVLTRWEPVMQSERLHALVRLDGQPGAPWLHEVLVREGLARIYTMPTDLPDGTRKLEHLSHLRKLENAAKASGRGLWGKVQTGIIRRPGGGSP